jgi:hypothetical protein
MIPFGIKSSIFNDHGDIRVLATQFSILVLHIAMLIFKSMQPQCIDDLAEISAIASLRADHKYLNLCSPKSKVLI